LLQSTNLGARSAFAAIFSGCPLTTGAIFSIGASTRATVQTGAFDLSWDAAHARLYGSPAVPSNQVAPMVAIDPATSTVLQVRDVAGNLRLAISDQDQFLYTAPFAGGSPAMRYTLPLLTAATAVTNFAVADVAAAPGAPATVAVFDTDFNRIKVVDGTAVRPSFVQSFTSANLVWGSDASTLYSTVSAGFERFTVDSTGLTSATVVSNNTLLGSRIFFDAPSHHIHGNGPGIFDEQGALVATAAFPASSVFCVSTAQGALDDQIFYACVDQNAGLTIHSFDALSGVAVAQVMLAPVVPTAPNPAVLPQLHAIARFGTDGLAVATDTNVYLYNGPFVH
jgi:hypothetical protein